VAHTQTLILPVEDDVPEGFVEVGQLVRREVDELVVGYQFDLRTHTLTVARVPNPHAGRGHAFRALRHQTGPGTAVVLRAARTQNDSDEEK
jgi:hypothetical protein